MAIAIALAAGLVVGILNGVLVSRLGVNSFIATLGTMIAASGLALVVSASQQVPIVDYQAGISFGHTVFAQFTPQMLITFALAVVLAVFLGRTRIGREFYALGGSREAAVDAGIPIGRRLILGFTISALVASAAGVLVTIELTTADPNAGNTVLLNAIAAAVIGGTSLAGGRGTILGTVLGALAVAGLTVGLEFAGIGPNVLDIVIGAVMIGAVTFDISGMRAMRAALGRLRGPHAYRKETTAMSP